MKKYLIYFASWLVPDCLIESEEYYRSKNIDERIDILDYNFKLMFYVSLFLLGIFLLSLIEINLNETYYSLYFLLGLLMFFPLNTFLCIIGVFRNG